MCVPLSGLFGRNIYEEEKEQFKSIAHWGLLICIEWAISNKHVITSVAFLTRWLSLQQILSSAHCPPLIDVFMTLQSNNLPDKCHTRVQYLNDNKNLNRSFSHKWIQWESVAAAAERKLLRGSFSEDVSTSQHVSFCILHCDSINEVPANPNEYWVSTWQTDTDMANTVDEKHVSSRYHLWPSLSLFQCTLAVFTLHSRLECINYHYEYLWACKHCPPLATKTHSLSLAMLSTHCLAPSSPFLSCSSWPCLHQLTLKSSITMLICASQAESTLSVWHHSVVSNRRRTNPFSRTKTKKCVQKQHASRKCNPLALSTLLVLVAVVRLC